MNEYIAWAVTLVLAYLIGSTPSGVIVTRLWRGVDIRSYGSGSTGTTNVLRTLGPKAAVLVFFLDVAKGAAGVAVAKLLDVPHLAVALAGVLVVVGHMWPVFAKFQGGKGVATGLGVLLFLWWPIGISSFLGAVIAMGTRYVSIGSLVGATTGMTFLAVMIVRSDLSESVIGRHVEAEYLAFAVPVFILIYVRHAENIGRLIKGTERRLTFGAKPSRSAEARSKDI